MKKMFCLVGASGTGKSTLLDYIKQNFAVSVSEVSARPFLPSNTDYVNSLDLFSQVLITQNRFVSFMEAAIQEDATVFSRSPVDSLAYERVLNKAPFIENLLKRQIEITKPLIQYLYIPIEFPMQSENDTVRGTNTEVQVSTDGQILKALNEHHISYINLGGSLEVRFKKLDRILKEFKR